MPKHKPMPSLERLNELFEVVEIPLDKYGELSGLMRKIKRGPFPAGSVAGSKKPNRRNKRRKDWKVWVDGEHYAVSRIVYYMVYKEDPCDSQVDHEDQNWLNNNSWNLRLDLAGTIQHINKPLRIDNTSGIMGVSWDRGTNKWRAYVYIEQKQKYLGVFSCKIEAARVVNEKWIELGWHNLGRNLNSLERIKCSCEDCMQSSGRL